MKQSMQFLEEYQQIIAEAVDKYTFRDKPGELYEPMNYIISHGGKRLRPMMVLMACDMFGGDRQKALKPALAIEFFHNFTLIHDDIMDEAPLRRNQPTIHELHGVSVGILAGDAMMFKALKFFEGLEADLYKACMRVFVQTGLLLCEGQQYDINFETQEEVSFNEYIRMITYKTGVLTASSFEIGALIAGAEFADARAIFNFGKHVGIAFQIMDDYLDVFGNQQQVGKKHAGDIYENKKSVLYLLAMQHATDEERKELKWWYSKKTDNIDKVYSVEKIFRRCRVDEKALQLVQEHNDQAQHYLDKISLSEARKRPFVELANYLLHREK